jgi:hypothetical protein
MLDIFSVFSNQGRAQLNELLSQLWNKLCADEVFDRGLGICIGVDVYVELSGVSWVVQRRPGGRGDIQHTRFLQCRELAREL